jgi:hypothetical protein
MKSNLRINASVLKKIFFSFTFFLKQVKAFLQKKAKVSFFGKFNCRQKRYYSINHVFVFCTPPIKLNLQRISNNYHFVNKNQLINSINNNIQNQTL